MKITEKMPNADASSDWHLRVFAIQYKPFSPGRWRAYDVCSPFWRFYANNRDGMELELLGESDEKERFALKEGKCYFVPPGVRFSGYAYELVHHFYIHFDVLGAPPLLFPAFRGQLSKPFEIPSFQSSGALQNLAQRCWNEDITTEDSTPPAPLALRGKSLLFAAFAVCMESWDTMPAGDLEWVRPALEYIESHLDEALTNATLSALCHFCPDYFIVRFRDAIGQTPGQYLLERRLSVAAQQLLFSAASIEAIAARTGFCDRFHFSRAFKKRFGISPVVYRKSQHCLGIDAQ